MSNSSELFQKAVPRTCVDRVDEETAQQRVSSDDASTLRGQENAAEAHVSEKSFAKPPDGGAAAWLVVLGTWCTSFCSFGWLNSIGVFQEYYQNEMLSNYSPSTISWISSLQTFFMLATGPIVGAIYDRHGPRWLLLGGSLMHIFGIMMASLSTEYYQILLSQGVCSGIGASAVFQPALACVAGWFNKKRGAAFGIVFTGSSLGGVVFSTMVPRLMNQVGFGWTMRICAFLILCLLLFANLTVRAWHLSPPQEITVSQFLRPLKEGGFLFITFGFFFFTFGYYVPITYLSVQALSSGMDPNLAQYLLSILNASSLFGRLSAGLSGDKVGSYNAFIFVSYLTGIWIMALWLPATGSAALLAFSVLFGFFSGAYASLMTPLIVKVSPMNEIGFRIGVIYFLCAIAGLTTSPISGVILDGPGGWVGVKIFSGIFCLVGTTFILVTRMKNTGWKLIAHF